MKAFNYKIYPFDMTFKEGFTLSIPNLLYKIKSSHAVKHYPLHLY